MNIREIQKERNAQYEERHALAVGRLRGIVSEETVPEQYLPYFQDVAIFLLELENVRRKVENGGAVSAIFPGCGDFFIGT